jgi:hypothetical protein
MKTRLKEAWCYLHYPAGERPGRLEWVSARFRRRTGLLARASKKLASDEGLLPELGRRASTAISRNTSGTTSRICR